MVPKKGDKMDDRKTLILADAPDRFPAFMAQLELPLEPPKPEWVQIVKSALSQQTLDFFGET
jgi:hypothetical protein